MKEFLKTTIVGGVIFLLPVAMILLILSHARRLAGKVAEPISNALHFEHAIAGVGGVTILAVLLLIIVSFAAGLIARTRPGRRVTQWLETSFLGNLPQYQLVKSMSEGLAQIEGAHDLQPVLINIDDGWQIGYMLEPLDNGWVAVFVPQAPTPMSGNVMYVPAERTKPLNMTMVQAGMIVKRLGLGSRAALSGTNLALRAN